MIRVYSVDKAEVRRLKSDPLQIGILAEGQVPTTGWRNPRLGPWFYVAPPEDGIQDFDLVAEPLTTGTIVIPVFRPVAAELTVARDPDHYWGEGKPLVGMRIHAQTNRRKALLEPSDGDRDLDVRMLSGDCPEGGDLDPWPWPSSFRSLGGDPPFPKPERQLDLNQPISDLLGRTVRLYRTGDLLAQDFRPDRVNIEVDPSTARVVDVRFG